MERVLCEPHVDRKASEVGSKSQKSAAGNETVRPESRRDDKGKSILWSRQKALVLSTGSRRSARISLCLEECVFRPLLVSKERVLKRRPCEQRTSNRVPCTSLLSLFFPKFSVFPKIDQGSIRGSKLGSQARRQVLPSTGADLFSTKKKTKKKERGFKTKFLLFSSALFLRREGKRTRAHETHTHTASCGRFTLETCFFDENVVSHVHLGSFKWPRFVSLDSSTFKKRSESTLSSRQRDSF